MSPLHFHTEFTSHNSSNNNAQDTAVHTMAKVIKFIGMRVTFDNLCSSHSQTDKNGPKDLCRFGLNYKHFTSNYHSIDGRLISLAIGWSHILCNLNIIIACERVFERWILDARIRKIVCCSWCRLYYGRKLVQTFTLTTLFLRFWTWWWQHFGLSI